MNEPMIKLSDAIDELRDELTEAMKRAAGKDLQFELGPVTMEFEVAVTNAVGGKAGAQFWVVSLGGDASHQSGNTHRVSLQLKPVAPSSPDGGVRVNDTQSSSLG